MPALLPRVARWRHALRDWLRQRSIAGLLDGSIFLAPF
jgi:hypothetical protein